MNKYVWAECPIDEWPTIKTIMANSLKDAENRIIEKYVSEFEIDEDFDSYTVFRNYLNNDYSVALSDVEIYEEL